MIQTGAGAIWATVHILLLRWFSHGVIKQQPKALLRTAARSLRSILSSSSQRWQQNHSCYGCCCCGFEVRVQRRVGSNFCGHHGFPGLWVLDHYNKAFVIGFKFPDYLWFCGFSEWSPQLFLKVTNVKVLCWQGFYTNNNGLCIYHSMFYKGIVLTLSPTMAFPSLSILCFICINFEFKKDNK